MAKSKEMEIAIKIAGKVESSFKNALGAATKGLGKIVKAVSAATTAAAAAVGALGMAAVNVGREFEAAMSQVAATMLIDKSTEAGRKNFEILENAARECGRSTAFSAKEAAEALNYLALAGYTAEEAATALPTVLKLAGAGAMELGAASDMVTDSMSALGIATTEANLTNFADQLAQTASKSNTSVSQLGEAILTVGGTAKDLAGGTTELNTALGILADNGIKASEGGTHLRNMILALQEARNGDAAAVFREMGISAYTAEGEMRSLGDVFGDLNDSLAGASSEKVNKTLATIFKQTDLASARAMLAATVGDVQGLTTVMNAALEESGSSVSSLGLDIQALADNFDQAVTGEEFAAQMLDQFGMAGEQAGVLFNGLQSITNGTGNRFKELTQEIENCTGACEDMYAIQLDNLNGDIAILKSGLSDLGISIYQDLSGPLRSMTQLATSMVGELSTAYQSGGMEAMVSAVGGCLSQAVNVIADNAPRVVGMGVKLLENFIGGITENSGLLADAAADVLFVFVNGLFTLVPQVIFAGIDIIARFAQSVSGQLPQLMSTGTQAITNFISGMIQRLPMMISTSVQLVGGLAQGIMQGFPQIVSVGIDLINSLAEGIQNNLPKMIPAAMESLMTFSGTLRENVGGLVDAGLNMIIALARSLIANIPVFVETIPTIITNICGIINDNAPKLLIAGIQLIIELVAGLIQAIPTLIANIPKIIQAIVSVFTAFNWVSLGGKIITCIGNGIKSLASAIPQALKKICTSARNVIHGVKWSQLGGKIITFIANGLRALATKIPETLKNIGTAAIKWFKSIDWIDLGISIIKGIISGLVSTGKSLWNAIKSLFTGEDLSEIESSGKIAAESYTEGMENAISDISMPAFSSMDYVTAETAGAELGAAFNSGLVEGSTNMAGVAATVLGTGILDGMDDSWQTVNNGAQTAMQDLSMTVTTEAQSAAKAVKSAFEDMTITIPKPKIPNISVSTSSVPYGDGGSVSVPDFSVSWNALGGIFDRPTIFNTPAGMQGVGEKGAEAVLPLDTLWAKMKEILNEAVAVNGGSSIIDGFMERLNGIGTGGAGNTLELAGTGGLNVQYSPVYNLYGSATKQDVVEADRISQAEFNKRMKQYVRDQQRRNL